MQQHLLLKVLEVAGVRVGCSDKADEALDGGLLVDRRIESEDPSAWVGAAEIQSRTV
jgi:hypothetical protein